MADAFCRRALYTDAKQAKHTFVSLDGYLEKRQAKGGDEKMSLKFDGISASGFLHKCGIRDGDRLISVNFVSVHKVPFDMLVDSIRGLTPLVLGVKRTSKDGDVKMDVVMEIVADKHLEPYLKFHGIYFWEPDTKPLHRATIISYIPLHVHPMTLYLYDSSTTNVTIIGREDNEDYWLTVDEDNIVFRKQNSDKALFTMHKYNSNQVPQTGLPVILVPQSDSSQCLAATDELSLADFNETLWTGRAPLPDNRRFLLLELMSTNLYRIESSVAEGNYLAKRRDGKAIMSTECIPLTVNEEGRMIHPTTSSPSQKQSQE